MRGLTNDCLRRIIALHIRWLGLVLTVVLRIRASTFLWSQKRLFRNYGITSETPILTFGPELELLIERAAEKVETEARFAWTSGSTAKPKRILYTKRRLRMLKLAYVDFVARCCWSLSIKRSSLYVFSTLNQDNSLTSMLLEEQACRRTSHRCRRLIACMLTQPCSLSSTDYGVTSVRLRSATVPCNSAARAVHLLSGVGGWSYRSACRARCR